MHEIDFEIHGSEMQFVEIELDPQEAVVAEAGAMLYMDKDIEMETKMGAGLKQSGFLGKVLGAGKRMLTGESLFMTVFQNRGMGKQKVSFGAPYPGKIIAVNLQDMGNRLIAQKGAFLCAADGVTLGIALNKKIKTGFFGGEGFVMQKIEGDGKAFVHAGGTVTNKRLEIGETIRVDTGCIVGYESTVKFDTQYVGKIKSALFGGEGLFFATLTGPGQIWLQSLPFSKLTQRIHEALPIRSRSS